MKLTTTRLTVLTLALTAVACGGPPGSSKPSSSPQPGGPASAQSPTPAASSSGATAAGETVPAAAIAEATTIFQQRCAPCHGALGKGDGAASAALVPRPRDLTSVDWQASVTDTHVEAIIAQGGPAVGKAATMPPNPDLVSKPDVIKALRMHVRSLKGQ